MKKWNIISYNYETITKDMVTGIHKEKKGSKEIFEVIMAQNFSKLMTDIQLQIQEAQN